MPMRMQLLGNRPTALQTGVQGKVAGLVSHPAGRHACVCMRATSTEDSNANNSAQPDIAFGSKSMVPFTQIKGQLLDSVALIAKSEAQLEEVELSIHFDEDLEYLLPSLAVAHLVPEIMRAVNWQFHIWGDTTPVYSGVLQAGVMLGWLYVPESMRAVNWQFHITTPWYCGVLQAAVMLGWLYVAARGAGMVPAPRTNTASPCKMMSKMMSKMIQQLPVTSNSSEMCQVSPALTALMTTASRRMKDKIVSMEKQLHVMRVDRSRYVALGVQLAALLCSELVQEYTSPAPGVLYALYATQGVASLAWLYFFIYYRRIKDQP